MLCKTVNPSPILRLDIPVVPPSPNRVLGKHWSTKAGVKNEWVQRIRQQFIPRPENISLAQPRRVRITLCHARLYDKDNAYAACKPVIDALKHWQLIWDDSMEYLNLRVAQEKCPHKQRHTIIEIWPA